MSLRTLAVVLSDNLENLKKEDFSVFVSRLVDRRVLPRVKRNRVEDRRPHEVAEVMVSTFTEAQAWRVAAEILEAMGRTEEARDLAQEAAEEEAKGGPAPGPAADEHFVDQHRLALIERVTNTAPILDRLLDQGIIKQEFYDKTRSLSTSQDQMRALYSGPLKAGRKCKDGLREILKDQEKFLFEELSGK